MLFHFMYIPAVPNIFGTRDRFHGRQFFHGLGGVGWGDGSGSHVSDAERQMKLCLVLGLGFGDPWYIPHFVYTFIH